MRRHWRPQMSELPFGAGTDVAIESGESYSCGAIHATLWEQSSYLELRTGKMIRTSFGRPHILGCHSSRRSLFVRWGFDLPMSVGAVAMSASTIIVAVNAQMPAPAEAGNAQPLMDWTGLVAPERP